MPSASRSPGRSGNVSAMSAARTGFHKWAAKNWGWFVPILMVFGLARGSRKAVTWSAPRMWRLTRWSARHPYRAARWAGRRTRRSIGARLDKAAAELEAKGSEVAARRVRKVRGVLGGQPTITCGYCGAQVAANKAEAHIDAHNAEGARQAAAATAKVTPLRRPSPRPTPAAARPAPAAANPPAPPAPAVTTAPSTGGHAMSGNTGTNETVQLIRAANGVGEMDPTSAWELDAQLVGLSRAALVLTENLGQYIETLDRIKTDPRVTAQAGVAVGQVAEVVRTFAQARQLFRTLYAAQFAAAENGVRQINRQGFFDPSRAA